MIKPILISLIAVSLSGCYINPPMPEFPQVPDRLLEPAESLSTIDKEKVELSDIIDNTAVNAEKYYKLREKYWAWQEWYTRQKNLYKKLD